jgi:hypothetical protein
LQNYPNKLGRAACSWFFAEVDRSSPELEKTLSEVQRQILKFLGDPASHIFDLQQYVISAPQFGSLMSALLPAHSWRETLHLGRQGLSQMLGLPFLPVELMQ